LYNNYKKGFKMKKILIFTLLVAHQLQANQIHPFVLTWRETIAGMIDASAFYLGFYGKDKTLLFLKRDAEMLGECTKMCAEPYGEKFDVRDLTITRLSSTSERLKQYIDSRNLPDEKDCVFIDTGWGGSLMPLFPEALWHFGTSKHEQIPSTFQNLVHLNPDILSVDPKQLKYDVFFKFVQGIEGTLPLKDPSIVGYSSDEIPIEIHSVQEKGNGHTLPKNDFISEELYMLYLAALKEEINNPSTQKRIEERIKFWSKIRTTMDFGNEKKIIEIAESHCDPKDPMRFAIARDLYEILKLKNFEGLFPNLNKESLRSKMKKLFEKKDIFQSPKIFFQAYIQHFIPTDKDLHSLSATEIAEMILTKKESPDFYNNLFHFYLSIPGMIDSREKMVRDNFFQAIGSVVGKLIAEDNQSAEQLYQLIFTQEQEITSSRLSTIPAVVQALINGNNPTKLKAFQEDLDQKRETSLNGALIKAKIRECGFFKRTPSDHQI
jgi:hypothetical protein